ncbi:MAG: sigma-54 interaction domain-containing protein [Thermodesulfobacteriota bacterium]
MANVVLFERIPDLFKDILSMSRGMPHSITCVNNLAEVMDTERGLHTDLLILNKRGNLQLSKFLPRLSVLPSPPRVLVIVDKPDIFELEFALREGALDYIPRHNAAEHLQALLGRLDVVLAEEELSWAEIGEKFNIHGSCPEMRKCLKTAAKASRSDVSVLIHGDTGTGKELFARAIHGLSDRRDENLIVVDCASLPATLVESILFGYCKGAFTGADSQSEGLVLRAHKGTLFLDEVSELPLDLQKKFLRVLQERRFRPVGAKQEVASDFRLLAATNKDLAQMVKEGHFRSDLLYRIQSLKLNLPALKDRKDDIFALAGHLLKKSCDRNKVSLKTFSREFLDVLGRHDWPGNVRELENVIDSVVAISDSQPIIYPEHLPFYIRVKAARSSLGHQEASSKGNGNGNGELRIEDLDNLPTYKQFRTTLLNSMEKKYFMALMKSCEGNVAKAMDTAKLSRARLYEFYKKYNLTGKNREESPQQDNMA